MSSSRICTPLWPKLSDSRVEVTSVPESDRGYHKTHDAELVFLAFTSISIVCALHRIRDASAKALAIFEDQSARQATEKASQFPFPRGMDSWAG